MLLSWLSTTIMRFLASFQVIAGLTTSLLLAGSLQARERIITERIAVNAENKHLGEWITPLDWGSFGSPVVGTSESARPYTGTELFAGPQKFASLGDNDYYHGVLPNGRIVKPTGTSAQVGMNPLGIALTPDGKFAIVSNDDEREGKLTSLQNPKNRGGYSLTVLDTSATPMTVVSQIDTAGRFFIGLQVAKNSEGGYKLYASGGGDNSIKLFNISTEDTISAGDPAAITIQPILPSTQGWVSNYTRAKPFQLDTVPNPASSTKWENFGEGAKITFPAGSALSSDGKYLYVACNGDNSLAVIDMTANRVVARYPVGYFPYSILLSDGKIYFLDLKVIR
jgi:YVTN family beta-propeller protein